jgi:hypothetical protein
MCNKSKLRGSILEEPWQMRGKLRQTKKLRQMHEPSIVTNSMKIKSVLSLEFDIAEKASDRKNNSHAKDIYSGKTKLQYRVS